MWPYPGISLILWQEGDLVKVFTAQINSIGIILRINQRRHGSWYDILVNGKVESLMHLDFEPILCKYHSYSGIIDI